MFRYHLCAVSSGEVLPALFNIAIGRRKELDSNVADALVP
jgi:hypothetical protein